MRKVLLVSSANPYPVVTNGCERLVLNYQRSVFAAYDVHFVATQPGTWAPQMWFHGRTPQEEFRIERLLELDFDFAFFVGFQSNDFTQLLTSRMPSFCLTDTHPHPAVPDGVFRGILSHRVTTHREDLLHCGGSYDGEVYYPNRVAEDFVISIGRIHPDKNQLELVSEYRDLIYARYGLPLYLAGGVDDRCYYEKVRPYIDGLSVRSTIDPARPDAPDNWLSAPEIAALLNRSRFFVTASPREFRIALAEALACATILALPALRPAPDRRRDARHASRQYRRQGGIDTRRFRESDRFGCAAGRVGVGDAICHPACRGTAVGVHRTATEGEMMADYRSPYETCPDVCGNLERPGVALDMPLWIEHSHLDTTVDQLRIEEALNGMEWRGKHILHVGVGNSRFAGRFSSEAALIDGITVCQSEVARAQSLGITNYTVYFLNKYGREFSLTLKNRYDFVIDNNLASYACCKYHFYRMPISIFGR
jgi:hypothetical protein